MRVLNNFVVEERTPVNNGLKDIFNDNENLCLSGA